VSGANRWCDAGDGSLDLEEFDEALRFAGLFLDKRELHAIQRVMDSDGSGRVQLHEFLSLLVDHATERRLRHARKVWAAVSGGAASVAPDAVLGRFRGASHVDVKAGRKSAEEAARAVVEELVDAVGPHSEDISEDAVVKCILQWGISFPTDELFCGQVEDCFGVPEGDLGREAAAALKEQIEVVRTKATEKKAPGQNLRFWLAGVCKHFDGDDCGGLTAAQFSRVLERLGLPLSPAKVGNLMAAFGATDRGPFPDRQVRVPWERFVAGITEGEVA
jgi:hypothetical protein